MLPWITVATARVPDSAELQLVRHDRDWVVRVDGRALMSSRVHDSEEALAEQALARADDARHVLLGGLGLGYTLRAVLDNVSRRAIVTVVELVPELVAWNREHLGELNDHPLADPRCRVVLGDVRDVLGRSRAAFDVILLDVDNGPEALARAGNQRLYDDAGVRACHAALRPGGVLGLWSANANARYENRLRRGGFDVEALRVAARSHSRAKHVLFLARRL